jgi:hypothetical protein
VGDVPRAPLPGRHLQPARQRASDRPEDYLDDRYVGDAVAVLDAAGRHGHARTLDAAEATPERLATGLAAALLTPPDYLPVPDAGAARAAELIAELL